jgi:glycosyltransferase involved in cell wall biosynthesis
VNLENIRLVLFFTRGVSLKTWVEVGMFDREIALYRRLGERGIHVTFVTYGRSSDLLYSSKLPEIEIACNRWGLPRRLYELCVPWLHASRLQKANLLKSNQMNGAEIALGAARIWRKPLLARCGFMWSDLAAQYRNRQNEFQRAKQIEEEVFNAATRVVVTTPEMQKYVTSQYNLSSKKLRVIPNYVLTDLFSPDEQDLSENRKLCFVGRLSEEKNPLAIVKACVDLDVELLMVGNGPLKSSIVNTAGQLGVKVTMLGNLPHKQLPSIMRQCSTFLLVSAHEGHPKTLLEAMSCGRAVIGANSPGIREIIRHGETGWLCGTDPTSIRAAIQELIARPELREKIGHNARVFVLNNFSLERILEMELDVIAEIIRQV